MRVETAIEEARALIAAGKYEAARAILAQHATHPKAQYWMRRLEKSASRADQQLAPDRWFTFRWDVAMALLIIGAFAAAIIMIGLAA